jgi:hypothetical protein
MVCLISDKQYSTQLGNSMRKFLETAWSDIRELKNLELYIILLAVLAIFIVDLFGVETFSILVEIILATLAVLVYGLIDERHTNIMLKQKLDDIEQHVNNSLIGRVKASAFFLAKKPQLDEMFSSADTIWLLGYSLSRTVRDNYYVFAERLSKGAKIRIMVLDPTNAPLLEMAGLESEGATPENWRNSILGTREAISQLIQYSEEMSSMQLGYLPYAPSFGLTIIHPDEAHAECFVEIYHHRSMAPNATFKLDPANDSFWYKFFKEQYEMLWQSCRFETSFEKKTTRYIKNT